MAENTEELEVIFARAQQGDVAAYGQVVRRFQDMAVGYAGAVLGDFHLAEDAAQEAFVEAFAGPDKVYGAAAFAPWLRRIVFKQCDRTLRCRHRAAGGASAEGPAAAAVRVRRLISSAIRSLRREP